MGWSLLRGFSSRAITGSPARLRRVLEEKYGSLDEAYLQIHTSWLRRELAEGIERTALAGLSRGLCKLSEQRMGAGGSANSMSFRKGTLPPLKSGAGGAASAH